MKGAVGPFVFALVAACGGARAPAGALASGTSSPTTEVSTMHGTRTPAPLPASEEITIPTDGTATVLGLEIEVVENIEKRDIDGHDFMRVQLRVRDPRGEGDVHLSTETVQATWQGWRFDYLGGWREYVQLRVTRPADNP